MLFKYEQYPNQIRLHPMLTIYNLKLKTLWNFECYKVVSCYSIKAYNVRVCLFVRRNITKIVRGHRVDTVNSFMKHSC